MFTNLQETVSNFSSNCLMTILIKGSQATKATKLSKNSALAKPYKNNVLSNPPKWKVWGVWCGAPGVRASVAVKALFKQGWLGGKIETWFSRDGMHALRQVRKTTLFLYLAEQLPGKREEQGENGGERVLHSKWPLRSLTKKSPHCPDLKHCEQWTYRVCSAEMSHCATVSHKSLI